jgi:N-acetylglucosamine kinase-like BadF-type ATPase
MGYRAARYVLGVDGGNTKTVALVARLDGTVAGVGRSGCSDIYTNPDPDVPLSEVEKAVSTALDEAGASAEALVASAFSMAGADWLEDYAFLKADLERRGMGKKITVVNDAVGALYAGLFDGPGVAVVCGTGAAIAARSAEGHVWHTSWWQEPQGGHQLGVKTLRAVYRADLGIDAPTRLTQVVLRYFEQESVEEVLHLCTARGGEHPSKLKISGLARLLMDIAHDGDPTALRIVEEHGASLGDYALAAARRVGIEGAPFTLALTGGVLRHSSRLLPNALIARVRSTSPLVQPIYNHFEPVVGALLLALESEGAKIDKPLITRLTATLPESSLFAT